MSDNLLEAVRVGEARPAGDREPGPYHPYRRLLATDHVRELSRLRPARMAADVAFDWVAIVTAWAVAAIWTRWWTVALACVVVGTRYYSLFIIAHDGMHRRLLRGRARNDLFNDLLIFGAIGAITRVNNTNHLLHHRHLASEEDPDRHRHCCHNKSTRPALLRFLTGLANVIPAISNVFLRDRGGHIETSPGEATRKPYTVRDIAILVGWQAALIAGLTLAFGWWGYPVMWLLPVYVFMYQADMVRSFLEHSHPEADERADEHRMVTYLANPVERMFFAPRSMNFHTVHHLWPSIPYYNLRAADRDLRRCEGIEGLEWRSSYVGYLLRYFRALPLAECRPPRAAAADG